jgi:hypothetical protein
LNHEKTVSIKKTLLFKQTNKQTNKQTKTTTTKQQQQQQQTTKNKQLFK